MNDKSVIFMNQLLIDMNLQAEKIKLIEWLVGITDIQTIERVSKIRSDMLAGQISEEDMLVIDNRLQLHEEDPESGNNWNDLKAQLLG